MADKTELELLQEIGQKVDTTTKEGREMKALVDATVLKVTANETEVKALLETTKKLDATIIEQVAEVKELKAKQGRFAAGGERPKSLLAEIATQILEHKAEILETQSGGLIKPIKFENPEFKASAI